MSPQETPELSRDTALEFLQLLSNHCVKDHTQQNPYLRSIEHNDGGSVYDGLDSLYPADHTAHSGSVDLPHPLAEWEDQLASPPLTSDTPSLSLTPTLSLSPLLCATSQQMTGDVGMEPILDEACITMVQTADDEMDWDSWLTEANTAQTPPVASAFEAMDPPYVIPDTPLNRLQQTLPNSGCSEAKSGVQSVNSESTNETVTSQQAQRCSGPNETPPGAITAVAPLRRLCVGSIREDHNLAASTPAAWVSTRTSMPSKRDRTSRKKVFLTACRALRAATPTPRSLQAYDQASAVRQALENVRNMNLNFEGPVMDSASSFRELQKAWRFDHEWTRTVHEFLNEQRPWTGEDRMPLSKQVRDISNFALRTMDTAFKERKDPKIGKPRGVPRGADWNSVRRTFWNGAEIAVPLSQQHRCKHRLRELGLKIRDGPCPVATCVVPVTRTSTASAVIGRCVCCASRTPEAPCSHSGKRLSELGIGSYKLEVY